jgi:radical SAM superfamily enzyme
LMSPEWCFNKQKSMKNIRERLLKEGLNYWLHLKDI